MTRPTWDQYFTGMARAASVRGDCTRAQVGAVIALDNRLVSAGYNGAPAGQPGCLSDGACPRGRHYPDDDELQSDDRDDVKLICACGDYYPCSNTTPSLSGYDNCISIHAEANALLYADAERCRGATLYVTHEPCRWCRKLAAAAGITRIVWPTGEA